MSWKTDLNNGNYLAATGFCSRRRKVRMEPTRNGAILPCSTSSPYKSTDGTDRVKCILIFCTSAFFFSCKNEDDPTLVYNYQESYVQQFQLGAFRFLRESTDSVVYLHCDVEACRKEDSESRCAKGCEKGLMRRRKRSLFLDAVSKQSVSIGPIDLQQQEYEEAQGEMTIFKLKLSRHKPSNNSIDLESSIVDTLKRARSEVNRWCFGKCFKQTNSFRSLCVLFSFFRTKVCRVADRHCRSRRCPGRGSLGSDRCIGDVIQALQQPPECCTGCVYQGLR